MQAMCVFRLVMAIGVLFAGSSLQAASQSGQARKRPAGSTSAAAGAVKWAPASTSASRVAKKAASSDCKPCSAVAAGRARRRSARKAPVPCHPPDYVDPRLKPELNSALRDLKRAGITPKITSAWRSSDDQGRMYKCSSSKRCRTTHPGLFKAMPPGQSAHEAGFALDISGIAAGPRGAKHLTTQGRQIVRIMEKHGFDWRYGLADPVHFEADPREHGYRNLRQAIQVTQTRCRARLLASAASRARRPEKRSGARAAAVKLNSRSPVAQRRKA